MPSRLLCLLALAFALLPQAEAGVYAIEEADGTLHLTDRPPSRAYRWVAGDAPALAPRMAERYAKEVDLAARRHGVDPLLVHAVIRVESDYDARAISRKGAAGLMQLMPETARRYGVADRFDPATNVEGGVRYLRDLLALYRGDLNLVLAAYNAGEAAVLRAGGRVPDYRETLAYVRLVRRHYDEASRAGGARSAAAGR